MKNPFPLTFSDCQYTKLPPAIFLVLILGLPASRKHAIPDTNSVVHCLTNEDSFLSMHLFSAGNVVEGFNLAKKGILPLLLWQFYRSCRSERVSLRLFLNFRSRLLPHPLIQKSLRWMRCLPRSIREFSPAALTRPIYSWTLRSIRKGFPRQEVFMSIRRHTLCL